MAPVWLSSVPLSLPCFWLENVITSGRRKGKKEEKKTIHIRYDDEGKRKVQLPCPGRGGHGE